MNAAPLTRHSGLRSALGELAGADRAPLVCHLAHAHRVRRVRAVRLVVDANLATPVVLPSEVLQDLQLAVTLRGGIAPRHGLARRRVVERLSRCLLEEAPVLGVEALDRCVLEQAAIVLCERRRDGRRERDAHDAGAKRTALLTCARHPSLLFARACLNAKRERLDVPASSWTSCRA